MSDPAPHDGAKSLEQRSDGRVWIFGRFGCERGPLLVGERLASGISEQPIRRAGEVLEVKPDGGCFAWSAPEQRPVECGEGLLDVLQRLCQRMGNGLEKRVDPVDWAT